MRRPPRPALCLAALVLLALGLQLLFPELALARGGGGAHAGGGGFSGGHSGGGGFGGGSGGVYTGGGAYYGPGFFALPGLLPLVLVALVALLLVARVAASHPEYHQDFHPDTFREPTAPPPGALEGLQAIKAADPGFEPESFLQRAEMTFLLVQRAYQDRDVGAARPYLTPQLWQTWAEQVRYLAEQHQRPVLENLNVRGLEVLEATHGPQGDSVRVHFDFVAAIHFLDDRDLSLISGSREDQRYGEDWTFWRAPGTRTSSSGDTTALKCPSCGGLLQLGEDGLCKFCGADIASGRYDWVVAEIRQDLFRGVRTAAGLGLDELDPATGIAAIKRDDPEFDESAFLERVGRAFFALEQAWQDRDLTASRAFMSPGLYLGWSTQVKQLIELHRKNVLEGLRIEEISPVKVTHGAAFDDITVRITATCADYEVDEETGRIVFGSREPTTFTEYWTFQRGRGVKTTARGALEKVCPNCGAPLEINQFGECRYCKAAVTSGRFDWVLSRIEQADEYSEYAATA